MSTLNTEENSGNSHSVQQTSAPAQTQSVAGANSEQDTGAAAERVSAHEFSAAIRAIEQRKVDEANRIANTVEVGKTIQDLNIDATPDEVMREVLAQRAAVNGPRLGGTPPQAQISDAQAASREQLRTAAGMLKDYYDKNIAPGRVQVGVPEQRSSWRDLKERRRQGSGWGVAIGATAAMVFFVINFGHLGVHGFRNMFDSKPAVHTTLAQLADGQTNYVDTDGLKKIIESGGIANAGDGSVSLSSEKDDNTWAVFKSGSTVYVKGYILPKTLNELVAGPARVLSDPNGGELDGETDQTVILPLKGVTLDATQLDSDGDWAEVTLEHVQVDANTQVINAERG